MALGQYVAGMGFSNVGLGLVHGMAHPLGAFTTRHTVLRTPSCYRMLCVITLTLPVRSTAISHALWA